MIATTLGGNTTIEIGVTLPTSTADPDHPILGDVRAAARLAERIGALQHLSGDRVLLGVGTGNPAHGDIGWRAAGMAFEGRGRRTDDALAVLPGLIRGETTTLAEGLEVTLSPGAAVPPILMAGNGDRARRRAAAHGDGERDYTVAGEIRAALS